MDGIVFDLEKDIDATTDLTDVLAYIKTKDLEVIATIAHDADRPTLPNVREVLMKEGSVDMVIPQVYDGSGSWDGTPDAISNYGAPIIPATPMTCRSGSFEQCAVASCDDTKPYITGGNDWKCSDGYFLWPAGM